MPAKAAYAAAVPPERLRKCHWCEEHYEIGCGMRDSCASKDAFATAVRHAIVLAPNHGDGASSAIAMGHTKRESYVRDSGVCRSGVTGPTVRVPLV